MKIHLEAARSTDINILANNTAEAIGIRTEDKHYRMLFGSEDLQGSFGEEASDTG